MVASPIDDSLPSSPSSAELNDEVLFSVLLFASLRDAANSDIIAVRASQTTLSVADLIQLCGQQYPSIAPYLPFARVAVNCEYSNPQTTVSPTDEIALIPPVSGGAELLPLVELTEESIDTARVIEAARSRSSGGEGAVLTFEGVVRNNANGQSVNFLEYGGYHAMALREMARISNEVQNRWNLPCAMTHRLGHLEIGEASIVIVVASPHRAESFEACRYAIDEVKSRVPIWKKETAANGSWWVENPLAMAKTK